MPHSHHSHSGQFCKHASGTLEEVVLAAIERGFEVYGLTEHVPRYRAEDLYPEEESMAPDGLLDQFDAFVEEAHRLKRAYADKISLLVGLETEHITSDDLDRLDALLERYGPRIEYIVGSVHHVNAIPIDFDKEMYQRAALSCSSEDRLSEHERLDLFFEAYFDAQYKVLERFLPAIVGHVDLCRLYTPDLSLKAYPKGWNGLERNVKFAVNHGLLFEANAAAFRKGWKTGYPSWEVLIKQYGGRFALSDDSHKPEAVGLNYARLHDYLQAAGVTELWHLREIQADPDSTAGQVAEETASNGQRLRRRLVKPAKMAGDWRQHGFWATMGA
ncbi:histidinol-phosphatase [Coniophora puteana RWD-64-598 SS2]|uniref:Histidinol-phosphatase n=1 Tax=Coniophora puteana (strain RWD-64-598) TaxID=741705 RepID=R7SE94_CONPW|nr:histidinol-phosphatase [Coniophora puteana RWD-64-598 SS2]EIW74067.1 histidinol-phosphatase [Coniophora puteana RWD-64-598 SS2]